MILVKLICLLSYFILVFLIARIFEFYLSSLAAGTSTVFQHLYQYLPHLSYLIQYTSSDLGKENILLSKNSFQTKSEAPFERDSDVADDKEKEFSSYGEFVENVEDTKACVWVIKVQSVKPSKEILSEKKWKSLSLTLHHYGIRTGVYKCQYDSRLCVKHKIFTSSFILSIPSGSHPKGRVTFHIYGYSGFDGLDIENHVFQWIKSILYPQVITVHSINEVSSKPAVPKDSFKKITYIPSMSFIYHSSTQSTPPLLLTALSVRFTGRIKFYMLKSNEKLVEGDTFAMTDSSTYIYGQHKGENFTYSCMELFFRTLHPEINDIFIVSAILMNMACWLELFLQKGGPLKRILFYLWGFTLANIVLISIWLPVIQLLYIPQLQPIINICLKQFQQMMLSNVAAIIRQDFLQISQHLYIVLIGFLCYGAFIGYLHCKFRSNQQDSNIDSISDLLDNDIQELNEVFNSVIRYITPSLRVYRFDGRIERILNRLTTPDLWLHSIHSNDYIGSLPNWKHCQKITDSIEYTSSGLSSESEWTSSEVENLIEPATRCLKCHKRIMVEEDCIPSYMLPVTECVICLDSYKCREFILGLPCGHTFHKCCVSDWFNQSGTGCNKNRCPVCRWPADLPKGKYEVIDAAED